MHAPADDASLPAVLPPLKLTPLELSSLFSAAADFVDSRVWDLLPSTTSIAAHVALHTPMVSGQPCGVHRTGARGISIATTVTHLCAGVCAQEAPDASAPRPGAGWDDLHSGQEASAPRTGPQRGDPPTQHGGAETPSPSLWTMIKVFGRSKVSLPAVFAFASADDVSAFEDRGASAYVGCLRSPHPAPHSSHWRCHL